MLSYWKPTPAVLAARAFMAARPAALAQTQASGAAGLPPLAALSERSPTPLLPPGDTPRLYLLAARSAVERGRSTVALESLERAETRLLDRSTPAPQAALPNVERTVLDIAVARRFVAARDRTGALRAIDDALTRVSGSEPMEVAEIAPGPMPSQAPTLLSPAAPVAALPTPVPVETYRLLPGHWALHGSTYDWVPPETVLRRVEARSVVEGRYGWVDGVWTWIPRHFSGQ